MPTQKDWEALCRRALGGNGLADLNRVTRDGIRLDVLYQRAMHLPDTIEAFPFTRSALLGTKSKQGWQIRQSYELPQAAKNNAVILSELNRGVTAINLKLSAIASSKCSRPMLEPGGAPADTGIDLFSANDLSKILDAVLLDLITLTFEPGEAFADIAIWLQAVCADKGMRPDQLRANFGADPISQLLRSGALSTTLEESLVTMAELARMTSSILPQCKAITVGTSVYHDAGASNVQELSLMLASAKVYLQVMCDLGMSIDDAYKQIEVQLCVDTDYFLSIAKLRAARTLLARFANACGADTQSYSIPLHINTSARMLTQRDPWVNMLRTTVAAGAAAIGGCNSLTVSPYDSHCGEQSELGRRVARNIQIILQEESNLHRVIDPLGGSGYVEHLTQSLCELAWEEFSQIESQGGLVEALRDGFVQRSVNEAWHDLHVNLSTRRQPIVGVTEFPDLQDNTASADHGELVNHGENTYPHQLPVAEQIEPLPSRRLAHSFELLRNAVMQATASDSNAARVFSAVIGSPPDYTNRFTFSRNLLGIVGLSMTPVDGDYPASQRAADFSNSGCQIAVICSAPDCDFQTNKSVLQALRDAGAKLVLYAGKPSDSENLGADLYLYSGCDTLQILTRLAESLGVDTHD